MPALRRARIGVAIAAAAALLSLTIAGRADAYVYWTDYVLAGVGRANLNGGGVQDSFIKGRVVTPTGVAVDARHVYWTDLTEGTIGRANLDGSDRDRRFVTVTPRDPAGNDGGDLGGLRDVAVDADHIYWTNDYGGTARIGRANIDGGGIIQDFIPAVPDWGFQESITVAAGHIYWTDQSDGTISRANTDGTGVELGFITLSGTNVLGDVPLAGVAVDGSHVYWTQPRDPFGTGLNTIGRSNIDGSGVNQRFITVEGNDLGDVAINADHIYWAHGTSIGRANLDGSEIDSRFISSSGYGTEGLAVNAGSDPPVTRNTGSQNYRIRKRKVYFRFKSDTPNSTFECKLRGAGLKRSVKRFRACHSPKSYTNLAEGTYTFRVRAVNDEGVPDPTPARDKFKVVR